MPNPNSYECKQCGATFASKEQLDGHNRREHSANVKTGSGAGSSGDKGTGWSGNNPTRKNM